MVQGFLICFFMLCLLYHIYTDVREMLLYDAVTLALLAAGMVYAFLYGNILQSLYGALLAGGSMLLLYILSRGGMGEGDVKLSFALGVWLGPRQSILCLLLAFSIGGILAVGILLCSRARSREKLPFGPFLCLGSAAAMLYGEELISIYLGLF